MLNIDAPFPCPGSTGFLRPLGPGEGYTPVRILQARGDGRFLVSLLEPAHPEESRRLVAKDRAHPDLATRASGNRTVSLAELAESACPGPRSGDAPAAPRRKRPGRSRT